MGQAVKTDVKRQYLDAAEPLCKNGGPAWLNALRAQGLNRFKQDELPHSRMEEWRHTNINAINNTAYRTIAEPTGAAPEPDAIKRFYYGDGWAEYVFVDGFLSAALSSPVELPEGVRAGGLADALGGPDAALVQAHLNQYLDASRNAYTALNTAVLRDGAFVHAPRNVAVETPIHFIFITTVNGADGAAHPRNLFVLEEGAEAAVVTSYVSLAGDAAYLNNVVEEAALGANARLQLYKIVEEGPAGNHLATTEVHLDRDSRLQSYSMSLTGAVVRNQLCTALDGEGANCSLTGLYLNDGKRLVDNALQITHIKPNCSSRILYKGILDGDSRAVFAGRVYVHPEAQRTDSDQLSNNLLLSDTATINSKPQLEIFADDVKCTHGATVGSPPPEVLFYFRSRGIDEATARGMLTYGFADEIVEEVELEALNQRLGQYVFEKYSPKF